MPGKRKPRETDEETRYPNMAAERAWDRQQHIERAMKAGMTRQQAEKHADQELRED